MPDTTGTGQGCHGRMVTHEIGRLFFEGAQSLRMMKTCELYTVEIGVTA
jgi:hypothetical protein